MSKLVLTIAVIVGAVAYLVVIEFGVTAGRIHNGVALRGGLDVGGLTLEEAEALLHEHGKELKKAPVVFSTEGFECEFVPRDLGWGPQPANTAVRAMRVGREDGPFAALGDRLNAWLGGVTVDWDGQVKPDKLDDFVDDCLEQGAGVGASIDEAGFREAIPDAIVTWPRRIFELPLEA